MSDEPTHVPPVVGQRVRFLNDEPGKVVAIQEHTYDVKWSSGHTFRYSLYTWPTGAVIPDTGEQPQKAPPPDYGEYDVFDRLAVAIGKSPAALRSAALNIEKVLEAESRATNKTQKNPPPEGSGAEG